MFQIISASITVMLATFTLGYLVSSQHHYKNIHLRIFSFIYICFYCEELTSLLSHLAASRKLLSVATILDDVSIIFEILLYILLLYFINYFYGIIKIKNIIIFILLFFSPVLVDFMDSAYLPEQLQMHSLFLQNISSVPLLVYILAIGVTAYRRLKNKDLSQLFRITLIIISSISFVFLLDGFLEILFKINIPKDPITVIVFSVFSFIYLHYFLVYIGKENIGPSNEFVEFYNISKREQEIIYLLLKGNSYKYIAEELFISIATVKTHIHNIYVKANVSSRFALMSLVQKK